ncbi:MAG TPA: guanylate kinase [Gammaproteobacteria bacterium]
MSGTLFVISAPSGAGKTSLVKALTEADAGLGVAVSHTTRPARPGEQEGVHYHFVAAERFAAMVAENAFLEHAEVHGNRYGTAREEIARRLARGDDLVLEIDWQGARQVREAHPDTVTVFILPPSRAALENRLRGRGQDSDAVIAARLAAALDEMRHHDEFDYLVINDRFEEALADLQALVRTRRLRHPAQAARHRELLAQLLTSH